MCIRDSFDLARAEGFPDIVVGAHLQADDGIRASIKASQHHNRHVSRGPNPAAHLVAIDVGQHDVNDHQVGGAGEGLLGSLDVYKRQLLEYLECEGHVITGDAL